MPSSKLNPSRVDQARLVGVSTDMPPAPAHGPWPTEVLLFTQMPVDEARGWQHEAADRMAEGAAPGHRLVLAEHPATPGQALAPGMQAAWLTLHLGHWAAGKTLGDAREAGAALLTRVLAGFGVAAVHDGDGLIWAGGGDGAAQRVIGRVDAEIDGDDDAPAGLIAQTRLVLNVNARPARVAEAAAEKNGQNATASQAENRAAQSVSMAELGVPVTRQVEIREAILKHYETIFASTEVIPQRSGARLAKPPWLRVKLPYGAPTNPVRRAVKGRGLHTVCESARCPNQGECWGQGTATFMICGDVCTRSCSFCAIFTGRPKPLDPDEPRRVAEAAREMKLAYVVVTAVNRDELDDGGAGQFVATIRELRRAVPDAKVEVLIPDFRGDAAALDAVFAVRPDVLNHNVETVPRLYDRVRPQAVYERSLGVLTRARAAGLVTKTGFMLGLGEEDAEVEALLGDLRARGVQIVTIGQYLRPSEYHHPVVRYATPGEFAHWRAVGLDMGFQAVQSGPLARSSYHARETSDQATAMATP